jgi:hypothetical protein
MIVISSPNHRLERAVTSGWLCARGAYRTLLDGRSTSPLEGTVDVTARLKGWIARGRWAPVRRAN